MKKQVISFHYTLTDKSGQILDASSKSEPLTFLEGAKQIIPGLEKEIHGMKKGDKKKVVVSADEGYGQYDERFIMTVGRDKLPEGDIKVGDQFQVGQEGDSQVVVVTKIEAGKVTLDGNHPLAGQELYFDVEVAEMRNATDDEVKHGHAHGPDGHGHHHH